MKAAVVHAFTQPLSIENVPKPEPSDGQVLVRIEAGRGRSSPHPQRLHGALSSVRHVSADGGYQGQLVAIAKSA
jgi:hypothetical protein